MSFKVEREEYVNKTFRIPKETLQQLENICEERNVFLNKLAMACIKYALENMEE